MGSAGCCIVSGLDDAAGVMVAASGFERPGTSRLERPGCPFNDEDILSEAARRSI